jgi:hypothetical protein
MQETVLKKRDTVLCRLTKPFEECCLPARFNMAASVILKYTKAQSIKNTNSLNP